MSLSRAKPGNPGMVERRRYIAESRVVEMMGRLHVDLFLQDRFLLNGVIVRIRLVRSKDAFSLMAGGHNPDYKLQRVDAVLLSRKAVLGPTVQIAHIKTLEKETAKYPIRPVDCKVYSNPQGAMSHTHENLFPGTLPKRLTVNKHRTKGTNELSRDDFGKVYTFFGFDLTPDGCDGGCFHLTRNGNLRIEMHFAAALEHTVNVIVYGEFKAVLEIDKGRNIIYNY